MTNLTHQQYKRLRDMADGHLTLYASVRYYDEATGARLDQPVPLYVGTAHDRSDAVDLDWWKPLLAAGLIALPRLGGGNRCTVTLDGHKAVAAHRPPTPRRSEERRP
ncbi:hypothetical protein O7626_40255 [Micromonospora sp. WMMD1102]|uniref:hypothetical protein n=1 Tax=Micromonospora sp. WMMD1102 TaxID=3016105 RepID=UPI0024156BD9|nr:hypothetical protein [Micromonospora sp. WMMD1102]MDG4792051.1 hypothetical protein [Micromonospora sp. WMMD1102]